MTASAEEQTAGWQYTGEKRSYRTESGELLTGTAEVDGIPYLFAPNGIQQTGWQTVNGLRYYYDPETGAPVFGDLEWYGETYHITREQGKLCDTRYETEEGAYLLDSYGVAMTGLQELDGKYYSIGEDGLIRTGRQTIDGTDYYFGKNGEIPVGVWSEYGNYYLTQKDGSYGAGWYTAETGETYYFGAEHKALRDMAEIDGNTYFFLPDCTMARGTILFAGKYYYFEPETGRRREGWCNDGDGDYYIDPKAGGRLYGWQELGGLTVYFDENGILQRGRITLSGKDYILSDSGILQNCRGVGGIIEYGGKKVQVEKDGAVVAEWERDGDTLYYTDQAGETSAHDLTVHSGMGLAYYAITKIGCAYWYGTNGEIATEALYKYMKKLIPGYYTAKDFMNQLGGQVFDCAGLVKAYLWSETIDSLPVKPEENNAITSTLFYVNAKERGTIGSCPWTPGTLVFRSDATSSRAYGIHHVGVYIGNGMVVEAKGHEWGVILSRDISKWTHWGRCYLLPEDSPEKQEPQ